jgi:hypothetical protein
LDNIGEIGGMTGNCIGTFSRVVGDEIAGVSRST